MSRIGLEEKKANSMASHGNAAVDSGPGQKLPYTSKAGQEGGQKGRHAVEHIYQARKRKKKGHRGGDTAAIVRKKPL